MPRSRSKVAAPWFISSSRRDRFMPRQARISIISSRIVNGEDSMAERMGFELTGDFVAISKPPEHAGESRDHANIGAGRRGGYEEFHRGRRCCVVVVVAS
jgi:hypothetical protein